jgi:hypothetical protein
MRPERARWIRTCTPTALLATAGFLFAGCIVHHHHGGPPAHPAERHAHHGPPPHAPAHGYRWKHPRDHVEMVFDSEVGVYVVVGHSGVYWDGDRYVRWGDGGWTASARIGGGWVSISSGEVPQPLRTRYVSTDGKARTKGRAHPRGRAVGHGASHPAKHGY